jgi:hypothetical protein
VRLDLARSQALATPGSRVVGAPRIKPSHEQAQHAVNDPFRTAHELQDGRAQCRGPGVADGDADGSGHRGLLTGGDDLAKSFRLAERDNEMAPDCLVGSPCAENQVARLGLLKSQFAQLKKLRLAERDGQSAVSWFAAIAAIRKSRASGCCNAVTTV